MYEMSVMIFYVYLNAETLTYTRNAIVNSNKWTENDERANSRTDFFRETYKYPHEFISNRFFNCFFFLLFFDHLMAF